MLFVVIVMLIAPIKAAYVVLAIPKFRIRRGQVERPSWSLRVAFKAGHTALAHQVAVTGCCSHTLRIRVEILDIICTRAHKEDEQHLHFLIFFLKQKRRDAVL